MRAGLLVLLVLVLTLTSCGDSLLSPLATDCVTDNSETNPCKLDGITVVAEKQDPYDDDDDEEDGEDDEGEGGGGSGGSEGGGGGSGSGGGGGSAGGTEGGEEGKKKEGGEEDGEETGTLCTEDQIAIAEEYERRGVAGDWPCETFTTADFTVGQGTHGHAVGYLSDAYTNGREQVRMLMTAHGVQLQINSDWRCPVGNSKIPKSSPGSRHILGIAGDFDPTGVSVIDDELYEQFVMAANAAGAGKTIRYTTHVHIDWR